MNDLSLVISAPSGAGKTTLIAELLAADERLEFSVSTTTRPKREGEAQGASYNFVGLEEFQKMIRENAFLEWAEVHGNYYGTTKKEIDRIQRAGRIPIFDVDVQGARSLKRRLGKATSIFIVPPSRGILVSRLRNRKTDSESQIRIRLKKARWELTQFQLYDYIIINDDIDVAVDQVKSIVTAELCRQHRASRVISDMLEDWSDNSIG
ncbi:MAG: guanylate kinase [Spirochaetes bacterium RBG_16_49_21]|nr:MAG: guanylate kinase [Spirochaetes bacterium RBG_16_49_21]